MFTRLSIINSMLASVGTAQLAASNTTHPNYISANTKLNDITLEQQAKGWWFNKSIRTLRPSTTGEIILPSNTLHADPTDRSSKLALRRNKLYDLDASTYNIGREVEVVFVENVDIEDLPPAAVTFFKYAAVFAYYVDKNGGEPKLTTFARMAAGAEATLKKEDLRNRDLNFFDGPDAQQFRRHSTRRAGRLPI